MGRKVKSNAKKRTRYPAVQALWLELQNPVWRSSWYSSGFVLEMLARRTRAGEKHRLLMVEVSGTDTSFTYDSESRA